MKAFIRAVKRLFMTPYFLKVADHFCEIKRMWNDVPVRHRFLVFVPSLQWSGSGLIITGIASLLRAEGFEPIFVFDDRLLSRLDTDIYSFNNPRLSYVAYDYGKDALKKLLRCLGFTYIPLHSVPSESYEANEYVEDYWTKVFISRRCRWPMSSRIKLPGAIKAEYQNARKILSLIISKLNYIVNHLNFQFALILHGDIPLGGNALIASYYNLWNIPFLNVQWGFKPDHVKLKWNGTFSSPYDGFWDAFSGDLPQQFREYFLSRLHVSGDDDLDIVSEIYSKSKGKRLILMFPNVAWDGSVYTAYIHNHNLDWVIDTIKWAADHNDVFLVIRMHPHEAMYYRRARTYDILSKLFRSWPSNVMVIPPHVRVSSYTLIREFPHSVLTVFNGTLGLEYAALTGKKPVMAGISHYSLKGFTIDALTSDDYYRLLLSYYEDADAAVSEKALRYAYWHFEYSQLYFPLRKGNLEAEDYIYFPTLECLYRKDKRLKWFLGELKKQDMKRSVSKLTPFL